MAFLQHLRLAEHRRTRPGKIRRRVPGPPPSPSLPAVRAALVALLLGPPDHPARCPHCRRRLRPRAWRAGVRSRSFVGSFGILPCEHRELLAYVCHSASLVRCAALRSKALSFANTCSICSVLASRLQQHQLRPARLYLFAAATPLSLPSLSATTMSPCLSSAPNCSPVLNAKALFRPSNMCVSTIPSCTTRAERRGLPMPVAAPSLPGSCRAVCALEPRHVLLGPVLIE